MLCHLLKCNKINYTKNYNFTFICRSSPYNDEKKHNKGRKLNKMSPFLNSGSSEFFEKNPYLNNDHKSTYNMTSKIKFKGTPFIPSSTIKNVSNISVLIFFIHFRRRQYIIILYNVINQYD